MEHGPIKHKHEGVIEKKTKPVVTKLEQAYIKAKLKAQARADSAIAEHDKSSSPSASPDDEHEHEHPSPRGINIQWGGRSEAPHQDEAEKGARSEAPHKEEERAVCLNGTPTQILKERARAEAAITELAKQLLQDKEKEEGTDPRTGNRNKKKRKIRGR
jgi:hypothetical protein